MRIPCNSGLISYVLGASSSEIEHIDMSAPTTGDTVATADESKAIEFKNRLLHYDRTASKRTQVIDDESDYFGADLWQTPEERAKAKAREERLRAEKMRESKNRCVTIDFQGNLTCRMRKELEGSSCFVAGYLLRNIEKCYKMFSSKMIIKCYGIQ